MGYLQGVQVANQTRGEDRRARQQELANYIKGFEKDKTGKYTPNERGQAALDVQSEKVNQQLAYLQEQNKAMQSTLNERSMTTGVTQMVKGSIKDGWATIQKNKPLADMLKSKGIHNVAPIDWNTDHDLYEAKGINIKPEDLHDPIKLKALNSAYMKVMGPDGKWKLATTENLVQSTGTMGYLPSGDRKGMVNRFNKLGEILKGHITTPEEENAKNSTLNAKTSQANYAKEMNEFKLEDLQKWQEANPDGTVADYLSSVTPVKKKELTVTEQLKLQDRMKSEQLDKNEKQFIDSLKTATSKEYTSEVYQTAKTIEASNKKKGISLPNTYIKGIYENVNSAKEFKRLSNEIDNIPRDMLEKVKKDFSNLFGLTSVLTGTPEEKAKQQKAAISKIHFETKLGLGVAKYVKMMSGAAVTEQEFDRYNYFSQAGSWSDVSAAKESIRAFSDSLSNSLDDQLEGVRVKNPWTYMNRKTDIEDYEKPKAKNPFRKPNKERAPLDSFNKPNDYHITLSKEK